MIVRSVAPAVVLRVMAALLSACGAAQAQVADNTPATTSAAQNGGTFTGGGLKWGPLTFYGELDAGILLNPARPGDGVNFGHLFTDKANQFTLNQLLLGVGKPVDPTSKEFDWGVVFQGFYGSDARYSHFLGELDYNISQRYQLDIVELDLSLHVPNFITEGGIDFRIGQYSSPQGFEDLDPKNNPFYSHSYIFNFAGALKLTGFYNVLHATDTIDLWGGIDSGSNTTLGRGDNNGEAAFLIGLGLTPPDGKFTLLALAHIGPEDPNGSVPHVSAEYQYENDVFATWKVSDTLSFTTELALVRDDAIHANGFGAAQYISYSLNDQVTLNGRAEFFRDDQGYFVDAFSGNLDPLNSQTGRPTPTATSFYPHGLSLGALTAGLTYKPSLPPLGTVLIRPEVRWDHSYGVIRPFNDSRDRDALTFASDVVLAF